MTASIRHARAALSANDRFKLRYPRYLKAATLAALVLTAVFVWLSPRYEPQPYVLRHKEFIIIPPIPEALPEPERPAQPAPPPVIPPELQVAPDDAPIDPFEFPDWNRIWNPAPPAPPSDPYAGFVASSAKPRLTGYAKADYPAMARHAGLEGTVVVHVLVGTDGGVIDAVVVRGVHPLLDRAAAAAARQCRFSPARQREFAVKAWVEVPYRFTLR